MARSGSMARVVAIAFTVALISAACGDDNGSSSSTTQPSSGATTTGAQSTTTLTPQKGGTLTISTGLAAMIGLDPAVAVATGCCGGSEMLAIYDTIVRYNPATAKFEMRTAQSLEPNADFTEWTLKLKPNIKFTDGTDYNAEAVKFTVERHQKTATSQEYAVLSAFLDTVTVVDPLTVKFKLKTGWANFPISLSAGAGMVVSPTAFAKAGANFNVNPGDAGAGPFKLVSSFRPNEPLVLTRNPNYYGGEVYLDEIRSIYIPGADAQFEGLKAGTIQATLLGDPAVAAKAVAEKYSTINFPYPAGNLLLLNPGSLTCSGGNPVKYCQGKPDGTRVTTDTPTKDPRIRQAIAEAIDVDTINQRVYSGSAKMYRSLVPPGFRWDPGVAGPKYDPADAKKLVDAAKADGWDGKLRISYGAANPALTNYGQAVQAMLGAVGITASIEAGKTLAQVQIEKDFDIYPGFAFGTSEDRLFEGLYGSLRNNRYGYSNADMDAALDTLRVAATDTAKTAALKKIADVWNRDLPAVVVGDGVRIFTSISKLQGVQPTAFQAVEYTKAWLQK
jgi:peptide/nickel transport system substrate-binding protein